MDNVRDSADSSLTVDLETAVAEEECLKSEINKDVYGELPKDSNDYAQGEDGVDFAIEIDQEEGDVMQKRSNSYAAKKTVAQGMMDIALITANANQLRYIIEFNSASTTFVLNIILITISLLLQVAVGVSLIFKGRLDLKGESKNKQANLINNYVVVGVFLVTIINVFIASFTITSNPKN